MTAFKEVRDYLNGSNGSGSHQKSETVDLGDVEANLEPLLEMMAPRPTGLSVSAANCTVNILKATPGCLNSRRGQELFTGLLHNLMHLLEHSSDITALCFIIGKSGLNKI